MVAHVIILAFLAFTPDNMNIELQYTGEIAGYAVEVAHMVEPTSTHGVVHITHGEDPEFQLVGYSKDNTWQQVVVCGWGDNPDCEELDPHDADEEIQSWVSMLDHANKSVGTKLKLINS